MFSSERLVYRELDRNDFELFCELYTDYNVMQFALLEAFKSAEEAKAAFEKVLQVQADPEEGCLYVANLTESEKAIGIVDYEVVLANDNGGIVDIGYFIKPGFWQQGFGFEMSHAMVDYLFGNTGFHKIIARCNADNKGSEKIMQKLGMQLEGRNRMGRYKNSRWEDELVYGILREDWDDRSSQ